MAGATAAWTPEEARRSLAVTLGSGAAAAAPLLPLGEAAGGTIEGAAAAPLVEAAGWVAPLEGAAEGTPTT